MHFNVKFIILLFSVVFENALCRGYLGDSCVITSGVKGICKLINSCPSALHALETQNIYPENCGFEGNEPIVCCVGSFAGDLYSKIHKSTTKRIPTILPTSTQRVILQVGDRSKQKCQEYGKYVYPFGQKGGDCRAFNSGVQQDRTFAKPKEFPHMALVGFEVENNTIHWGCSGSLISEKFVLSAAHCIYHRENLTARYILLGKLQRDSREDDAEAQQILIKSISQHPNYSPPSKYHDLALFELEHNANLNSHTRPACLNTNPSLTNEKVVATGWGRDSVYVDENNKMYSFTLELFTNSECNQNRISGFSKGIFEQTQLCAGIRSDFSDICQGDSGGPLQILNPDALCTYKIVGVTSIGKLCGGRFPGVYTKVSAYLNWIENIVWP